MPQSSTSNLLSHSPTSTMDKISPDDVVGSHPQAPFDAMGAGATANTTTTMTTRTHHDDAPSGDTDTSLFLQALPFDYTFTVDLIPAHDRVEGRFVGVVNHENQPLTAVLSTASTSELEHTCQQVFDQWLLPNYRHDATTRCGKSKTTRRLPVIYRNGCRALWNITLFPIRQQPVQNIVAVGGLVMEEAADDDDDDDCDDVKGVRSTEIAPPTLHSIPKTPANVSGQSQLFQLLPIAYCMVDILTDPDTGKATDYTFIEVNEHFEHMTGLTRETTLNRRVTEILPNIGCDPADWIGRTGRVVQDDWVDRFNSFSIPLQRWYTGVTYHYEGTRGVTLFVQNYSENSTMEEAIQESEQRHRTLFENMSQGVVYHAADGRITAANEAALRILGLTMDQMVGRTTIDPQWRFVRPDGSTMPVEEYPAVLALQGKTIKGMTIGVYNCIENDFNWTKLDARPRFRPGEDKPFQAYTIFSDMTEEVKVEQNLLRAKEKAEEADQLKSAFLATMSHEIRTPLNGIMGHIDLILSNGLDEEYKTENLEGLQVAMESGRLLLSIIQDILDLSKIEARQLDIDCESIVSIRVVVDNTMKLANAFRLQRKKVDIELSDTVDGSISDFVLGDQFRLQQILNNLLSNAIKFTDQGFVSLDIQKCPGEEFLQFCVHDTGKGIPEDRLDIIFEPFRQCEFGDTRKHGGTGLGLTICKKLVELMGGTLRVETSTEPGQSGSRFYLTLPYHPATPAEGGLPLEGSRMAQQHENASKEIAYPPSHHARSGTILLAEDDDVSRKVAKKMIERVGFNVLQARNGAEAVRLFEKHGDTIDLVLMDIMMPGVDGIEATQRIRCIEQASSSTVQSVPIVALSAGAMKGDKEKGLEAGMSDYLYKPISLQALVAMLGKFFGEGTCPSE